MDILCSGVYALILFSPKLHFFRICNLYYVVLTKLFCCKKPFNGCVCGLKRYVHSLSVFGKCITADLHKLII